MIKKYEQKGRAGIDDISKRVAARYKGVTIQDVKTITDLVVKEIRDILIYDGLQVDLKGLCCFDVVQRKKYGRDFAKKKQIDYGYFNKIRVRMTKTIKAEFDKVSNEGNYLRQEKINTENGYESPMIGRKFDK